MIPKERQFWEKERDEFVGRYAEMKEDKAEGNAEKKPEKMNESKKLGLPELMLVNSTATDTTLVNSTR